MEQANGFLDSIFERTLVGSTHFSNDRKQQQQEETFLRAIETPQTPWGKRYETYQLEPQQEHKKDLLDKIFENFGWELCHGEEDKDMLIKALAADEDVARILATPKSKWTSSDMHQLKGIVIHQLRKGYNPDPMSEYAELRDDVSSISSLSSYPPDSNYTRKSLLAFKGKSLTEEIREMEEAKQRKLEEEKTKMLEEEKETLEEEKKKIVEEKKQMEEKHRKMLEDATKKIQEEKVKLEEEKKKIKEAKLEEERKKIKEVKLEEERKKIKEEKVLQEQKAKERKLQKVLQSDLSSTDGDVMGLFSLLNSCCAMINV